MPRAKAFDPDLALERALELFWEKGFEATSMQDLVERMGINRFSLYSTFGDKRQLYRAALDLYQERIAAAVLGPLEAKGADLGAIRHFFAESVNLYSSETGWRGCFLINCAVDGSSGDEEESRRAGAEHVARLERGFTRCLQEARRRGQLPSGRSARELARLLLATALGIGVLARARAGRRVLEQAASCALDSLAS